MTAQTEQVLAALRELEPELTSRYKVRGMALFGSCVRGEEGPKRGIDLLVDFAERVDLFHLVELTQFLEERLGCQVDVIPRKALRAELVDRLLKDSVAVY